MLNGLSLSSSSPATRGNTEVGSMSSRRDSFEFEKRGQLFISTDNETISVVALCVRNPDCSPFGINR
jgi:hypothetical protein